MKTKKKAFTLVELLAVIVILAIILIIAVPKILEVIKSSKVSTMEDSAKLIAKSAESKKLEKEALGDNTTITCSEVAEYNTSDYGTCNITFNNGVATVTLKGKGKFDKLTCTGTKDNMTCTEENTNEPEWVYVAAATTIYEEVLEPYASYTYTVTNVASCKTYVKNLHLNEWDYTETQSERYATSICNGEGVNYDYYTTNEWFTDSINNNNFTYEDEEVRGFLNRTGNEVNYTYTVTNVSVCKAFVKAKHLESGEYSDTDADNYATSICNGEGVNYDYRTTNEWFTDSINNNHFTYEDEEVRGFLNRTGIEGDYTYTVTNASSCKTYVKNLHLSWGNSETQAERYSTSICNGNGVSYDETTNEWFTNEIDNYNDFTYNDEVRAFLSRTGNTLLSQYTRNYTELRTPSNDQVPIFIKFKSDLSEKYVCTMYDSTKADGFGTEPHCVLLQNAYNEYVNSDDKTQTQWNEIKTLFGDVDGSKNICKLEGGGYRCDSFPWSCVISENHSGCAWFSGTSSRPGPGYTCYTENDRSVCYFE